MVAKLIRDKEVWDNFVDESPHSLLFHKWDILKIIEKHTGYKLLPYGIFKEETLICVFPLFFKKFKGVKVIFSPPPQTGVPNLGFVMNRGFNSLKQNKKESYLNIVANEFDKEMKKISPNYVSISLVSDILDVRPFEWNNYNADAYFTYTIDLCRPLDEIWESFKKDLRSGIKQADKLDLKLSKSCDFSTFFEIEKKRYEEQGLNFPIISKDYLDELLKAYPESIPSPLLY